jgi:hypothetical protein
VLADHEQDAKCKRQQKQTAVNKMRGKLIKDRKQRRGGVEAEKITRPSNQVGGTTQWCINHDG